jgi:Leucine-rich repeat (LRR) protein
LSENDIEYISPLVNNLHELIELKLSNNCISNIKLNLAKLELLDISFNILCNIPQFKQCDNLLFLNVSNNHEIYDIPHNITKLQNLLVLDVSFSDIDYIPPRICKLKQLQILNVGHTLISKIPKSIVYMNELHTLVVKGCELNISDDVINFFAINERYLCTK